MGKEAARTADAIINYLFGGEQDPSATTSSNKRVNATYSEPELLEGKKAEERFDKNMPSASKFRPEMESAYNINWSDADLDAFEKALENGDFGEKAAYGKNLAKGNSDSNANGQDADTTLRYSQFADYLNNLETKWDPSTTTATGARFGQNSGKVGTFGKWGNIETEAMRQQRDIADMSKTQQLRKINRQQNYQDIHQKLKEAKQLQKLALEGKATEYEMARLNDLLGVLQYQAVEAPYNERMQRRQTSFERLGIPSQQANQIMFLAGGDWTKASMLASLYGTVMASPYQLLGNQLLQGTMQNVLNGKMDMQTALMESMQQMSMITSWLRGMGQGAVEGVQQGMQQ